MCLKEVDTQRRPAVFKPVLGNAPGVAKTYAMLSGVYGGPAGRRSCDRSGETHGRKPSWKVSVYATAQMESGLAMTIDTKTIQ